ncbi:MAG: hypothetical protein KBC21_01385 [Candidatus Pacebacteria bacterium]|nr:hypothetical protein [Candidatus Paceibacterota bacterium]
MMSIFTVTRRGIYYKNSAFIGGDTPREHRLRRTLTERKLLLAVFVFSFLKAQ